MSRPSGYYGYVVTHATVWAVSAFAARQYSGGSAGPRHAHAAGVVIGRGILKDRKVLINAWMIPFRDIFGFAVWFAGAFGRQVRWRDRMLALRSDGRICEEPQTVPERSK